MEDWFDFRRKKLFRIKRDLQIQRIEEQNDISSSEVRETDVDKLFIVNRSAFEKGRWFLKFQSSLNLAEI